MCVTQPLVYYYFFFNKCRLIGWVVGTNSLLCVCKIWVFGVWHKMFDDMSRDPYLYHVIENEITWSQPNLDEKVSIAFAS